MSLDLSVSRAVMRARTAERALHDRRPWTMEAAGHRALCSRTLGEQTIVFTAYLPAAWEDTAQVVLRCGEDVVDVVDVSAAGGGQCWTELRHEIVVAAL